MEDAFHAQASDWEFDQITELPNFSKGNLGLISAQAGDVESTPLFPIWEIWLFGNLVDPFAAK
jgi:hypothetical protein